MAANICLGIHFSLKGVTAALVEKKRSQSRLAEVFKIAPPAEKTPELNQVLIDTLVQQLQKHHTNTPPVALALSGGFYQSQTHHSEFKDQRMLKQTLRFDVEEDFAVDAESFALCYQPVNADNADHNLIVHTLDRQNIKTLLEQFEAAQLDALIAEPDINAWMHYIKDSTDIPSDQPALALAWTSGVLYLTVTDNHLNPVLARSCVCASPGELDRILIVEIKRSLALLDAELQPQQIIFHANGFSHQLISQLANSMKVSARPLPEPDAAIAFAGGAALGWLNRQAAVDFRTDGLPPRTLIAAQKKAFFGLSVALTFLMICICFVLSRHTQNFQDQISHATAQLEYAWKITNQQRDIPLRDSKINGASVNTTLQNNLRQLQGRAGLQTTSALPDSISPTLMLLLETLHTLPETFDLKIENIRVAGQAAYITGLVRNLDEVRKLHQAFKDNPAWGRFNYQSTASEEGSRFTMQIPIAPNQKQNLTEG
ncbi:MAG: hypothetical protein GY869_01405 [Planctomycetes bacterium]|nr:hypothetical protein [Planctomycetota bacterium]